MHRQRPSTLSPGSPTRRGFSLVATLSLMALLSIIVLGMMSLSVVSLRTAGQERLERQARSNARLALQMAIGELQRLAGPDGRVTAPSSLVAGESGQRHLTGVWEGWKWDGEGDAPDWEEEKDKRFKGWLVSSEREGERLLKSYAERAPRDHAVVLVEEGEEAGSEVRAGLVPTGGIDGRRDGGFAWAAFDASQKVDVSLSAEEGEDDSFARGLERLAVAHEPGFQAVGNYDWTALAERKSERRFLVSRDQSRLIGLNARDIPFHDVTSGSYGLLTDAAKGGLASDLSRLFEGDALPSEFEKRFLYSGGDTPLAPPPTRFKGANPLPAPDPSWALLHSHYRAYTRLSGGDSPRIAARPDPKENPSEAELLRSPAFNRQQIAPVIAKAQFVFSLTFGVNLQTLTNMRNSKPPGARQTPVSLRDDYITWLVIDPVITLWNPYNVPIEFNGASIRFYRIPLAFRLYKNGKRINEEYTLLTNAHTPKNFAELSLAERYYLLHLLPEQGRSSLTLQPGEHIVFTGQKWTLHGDHSYNIRGLEMRPGFHPPAGEESSDRIGGVTTQNIFVDKTGQTSGRDYNDAKVRTVAVKAGDVIGIDVKPERVGNGVNDLEETGGREITAFLKYYLGSTHESIPASQRRLQLVGGIELDYGEDQEKEYLPEYTYANRDLPEIVVNGAIPKAAPNDPGGLGSEDVGAEAALRWKEPFLIATLQLKTERDSKFPSRSWVNNAPTNLYASAGLDQTEDFAHQQYEFKWEPMTDWPPASPTIEISNENNRGYGGSGIYAQTGVELATFSSLPIGPAHSLGQLSHAPLNAGGQLPLTTRVIGNSYAPPLLPAERVREVAGGRTYLDHSYLANNALFDSWFLSAIADHPAVAGTEERSADSLLEGFFRHGERLPNRRFRPYLGGKSADEAIREIEDAEDGYRRVAEHLLVEAPFNVNSTRVAAWEALLASNFGAAAPLVDGNLDEGDGVPVLRSLPVAAASYEFSGEGDRAKWNGYRRLNEEQIRALAKEMVEEVRSRGPFQSLAEFVNRRPGGEGDTSKYGAVQAAIERSGLNDGVLDPEYKVEGNSGANPEAASGNTADGAPGVISQADLLTPLLPLLTVRGDTFTVRAYGEAIDPGGTKARAWCEATVQRFPEYVEAADIPSAEPTTPANRAFGRQFRIVSFRWLNPEEIRNLP